MEELFKYINQIENQLKDLNKIIDSNALKVKENIDIIISEIESKNLLKGDLLKLELIKTKINALSKLGGIKEIFNDLEKAENFIKNEVIISYEEKVEQEEKEKILKEIYIQVLESINENVFRVFTQNGDINKEIKEEYLKYIDLLTTKLELINQKGIGEYHKAYFYSVINDEENYKKYTKQAALNGEKNSINTYVEEQIQLFLKKFNKIENKKEKEIFLKENLEAIEVEIFQFIDDFYYNDNGTTTILKQGGNKELYPIIGDFYKKLGLFSEALSSYKSGIQSSFQDNYKLFGKIAELYKDSKIVIQTEDYKTENYKRKIIKKNYEALYQGAYFNNDIKNVFYGLTNAAEYSDTFEEKKEIYGQIISIFELNYGKYYGDEELILGYINACNKINSKILNEKEIYETLVYINTKHILLYANYLEENGEYTEAFINYITNYTLEPTKNNLDAIVIFMYDKIMKKISKEINENYSLINQTKKELKVLKKDKLNKALRKSKKYLIKVSQLNIEILFKEKEDLKESLINLKELKNKDIKKFFGLTIENEFYEKLDFKEIKKFFDYYNEHLPKSKLYLKEILRKIELTFNYKREIFEVFYQKIKNNEVIEKENLDDFKSIIESKNLSTILENINLENIESTKYETKEKEEETQEILKELKKKQKKKK